MGIGSALYNSTGELIPQAFFMHHECMETITKQKDSFLITTGRGPFSLPCFFLSYH